MLRLLAVLIFFVFIAQSQDRFTEKDREILISLQIQSKVSDQRFNRIDEKFSKIDERFTKIDDRFSKIDERFDKVDTKFDSINSTIFMFFGLMMTSFIALFGFIMWDRRSTTKPIETRQTELEQEVLVYKKIFKEVASGKPLTPELLHQFGI